NQLIARRVRDLNVYCELVPYHKALAAAQEKKPSGLIFTGGPNSVYEDRAPQIEPEIFQLGIPILGLCYGMQLTAASLGGQVKAAEFKEFGKTNLDHEDHPLFKGVAQPSQVWMSHADRVETLPQGFTAIASTSNCPYAAFADDQRKIYGFQFHAEVNHTLEGQQMLQNFVYDICGEEPTWTMANYAKIAIEQVREQVGDGQVLLGLSGGVDSSVVAALLSQAIGSRLTCIFVDHGLMRKNEGDEVEAAFKDSGMNFIRIDAEDRFLARLAGVSDPEAKRKAIGDEFVKVFEEVGKKIQSVDFLAQGTIYPDVIESGWGDSAVIKSHHNVGGLPDVIEFRGLVEPLRPLFKDEVRRLGQELGLPAYLTNRQPFPGPGLAIRIIGDITKEKLDTLREADAIFRSELEASGFQEADQYFAVLTNTQSVGVMGDYRTYDYTLALRSVSTTDFMTADWSRIPYDTLDKVSTRIINEVPGINRIVYDITSKPPATIEWE
ncbi:MAG: glutamine-hydrolyzing GMP synthase, partial [Eubacteriales bacterium]|nr:glutamine-hydrolyzing GMP synthase [Eubacteriales bacterium]